VPDEELREIVSTKLDTMFYSTKSSVYKPDTWYVLKFRAYRSPMIYGEASHRFLVNESPKSGT